MGATVAGRAPTHETGTGPVGAGPSLTLPRLWLVVVLGAIGVMELAQVPNAVDLAYHLKVGELIVAERAVPRTDMLAWTTAGRPWLDQNWGAQLALYGIWRLGGFPLLMVTNALCTVAAWGLVAVVGVGGAPGAGGAHPLVRGARGGAGGGARGGGAAKSPMDGGGVRA